jgi:intergrase/recombinase
VQALKLANAKSARAGIDTLAAAAERAKRAVEDAAAKHARAVKAEADASRAVEREKQREMLRDIKEQARLDKDKAKQVRICMC